MAERTTGEIAAAAQAFVEREFAQDRGWHRAIVRHFAEGFYGLPLQKTHATNQYATERYHDMQDRAYAAGVAFAGG